jgi:hypothetical protein
MRIATTPPISPNAPFPLLARIYTTAGVVAVPGNFATLTLTIYDTEDMRNPIVTARSLSPVSSYVYSTLQTDRDWTTNFDSLGYNFAYVMQSGDAPKGGRLYQLQFSPASGPKFSFNVPTLRLVGA